MRKLALPPGCPKMSYANSILAKHEPVKTFLTNHTPLVEQAIDDYINKLPLLQAINRPIIQPHERDQYTSVFSSRTNAFKEIITQMRFGQTSNYTKEYCQYCGINLNKSIDHFFPKEIYPLLSAATINLIPCCKDCNTNKSTRVYDSAGVREFINFYYDDFLDIEFLKCSIIFPGSSAVPSIVFSLQLTGLISYAQSVVQNHFNKLKLINIYGAVVGCYFEELTSECRDAAQAADLQNTINNKRNAMVPIYGVNYFKVALLKELAAQHSSFFHYLHV